MGGSRVHKNGESIGDLSIGHAARRQGCDLLLADRESVRLMAGDMGKVAPKGSPRRRSGWKPLVLVRERQALLGQPGAYLPTRLKI
jgi:hypothetical protein